MVPIGRNTMLAVAAVLLVLSGALFYAEQSSASFLGRGPRVIGGPAATHQTTCTPSSSAASSVKGKLDVNMCTSTGSTAASSIRTATQKPAESTDAGVPSPKPLEKATSTNEVKNEKASSVETPSAPPASTPATRTTTTTPPTSGSTTPASSPSAEAQCPPFRRDLWTPEEALKEEGGVEAFCQRYNRTVRPKDQIPKIFYGAMINFEMDMLEVMLHEIGPLLERVTIVESTSTHSLAFKVPIWPRFYNESRWKVYNTKNAQGEPLIEHKLWHYDPLLERKPSGWDVEKGQREAFILRLMELKDRVPAGSIIMANMDLDEIPARRTVLRWKYCSLATEDLYFQRLHFRYNLGCMIPRTWTDTIFTTNFLWPGGLGQQKGKLTAMYKSRRNLRVTKPQPHPNDIVKFFDASEGPAWHMSSFGSIDYVLKKNAHSPHGHLRVGEVELRRKVAEMIATCQSGNFKGPRVSFPVDKMPILIRKNTCYFRAKGWLIDRNFNLEKGTTTNQTQPLDSEASTGGGRGAAATPASGDALLKEERKVEGSGNGEN